MTSIDRNSLFHEERCKCGHLLALLSAGGVEIKCRRCKRTHSVALEELIRFLGKDKGPLSSDPSGRCAECSPVKSKNRDTGSRPS